MTSAEVGHLLRRARDGVASRDDAARAAELLETEAPTADTYDLLFVIGKANAKEFRPLVQRFLDSPSDPMLARISLQILCSWWRDYERCLEPMIGFVRGVDWDLSDGGYVRLVASTAAGEYLQGHTDPDLTRALLEVFDDRDASDIALETAYQALARSLGRSWKQVSSVSHRDWQRHIDADLIMEARRRAQNTGGGAEP